MNKNLKYRADIDGLRAISVIAVLIFHLDAHLLQGGFLGVDFFFIISGYLITKIIVKGVESESFSFLEFFARRIKRIFPALFVVIFFSSIFAILCLPSDHAEAFFRSARYAAGQVSNFFFSRKVGYFDDGGSVQPLLHTWSLGVEEQFYLVWPLVIFFSYKYLRPFSRLKILSVFVFVMVISFITNLILTEQNAQRAFYMFYTRAWEFCFGGIIALEIFPKVTSKLKNNILGFIGLAIVIGSIFLLGSDANILKWALIIPCLGASILIYSGSCGDSFVKNCLSVKPLVFMGLISYSLYLWHWPIITFYKYLLGAEFGIQEYIIISLASVLLGVLSYYFVEQKTRYVSWSNGKIVIIGLVMIAIFVGIADALKDASKASWHVENAKIEPMEKRVSELESFFETGNISDDEYDVLLFGDSHSEHYYPVIKKLAAEKGLKIRLLSNGGCPALLGEYFVYFKSRKTKSFSIKEDCTEFKNKVEKALNNKNLKYVFLAMRQEVYTETTQQRGFDGDDIYLTNFDSDEPSADLNIKIFKGALEYTVNKINESGAKLNILSQVPMLDVVPNICPQITYFDRVFRSKDYLIKREQTCYEIDHNYVEDRLAKSKEIYSEIVKKYDVGYFDPTPYIKRSEDENGYIIYKDDDHVNIIGAKLLYDKIDADNFFK